MRIAVGGIHTECSTYSPQIQTGDDFTVLEGPDLATQLGLRVTPGMDMSPLFYVLII